MYRFFILLHLITSFCFIRSFLVPYSYVSIESSDYILLSSFERKTILLISSIKTLCLSLLKLFCVFNFDLLFLINYLWFFKYFLCWYYFFLDNVFYSQVELLLKCFYSFQIWVFFLWHTYEILLLIQQI